MPSWTAQLQGREKAWLEAATARSFPRQTAEQKVLREAYADSGSMILSGLKGMGADFTYAWPIARFAVDPLVVDDVILPNPPLTVEQPNYPNIAANVTYADAQNGEVFLPPTFTKTVGGIKVGFIGLTSDIVPRMAKPFSWA